MSDPVEKLERLAQDALAQSAARESARQARAAENRRLFPTAAEAMDKLACFSPRVVYAREGNRELGKKPAWQDYALTERNNVDSIKDTNQEA